MPEGNPFTFKTITHIVTCHFNVVVAATQLTDHITAIGCRVSCLNDFPNARVVKLDLNPLDGIAGDLIHNHPNDPTCRHQFHIHSVGNGASGQGHHLGTFPDPITPKPSSKITSLRIAELNHELTAAQPVDAITAIRSGVAAGDRIPRIVHRIRRNPNAFNSNSRHRIRHRSIDHRILRIKVRK